MMTKSIEDLFVVEWINKLADQVSAKKIPWFNRCRRNINLSVNVDVIRYKLPPPIYLAVIPDQNLIIDCNNYVLKRVEENTILNKELGAIQSSLYFKQDPWSLMFYTSTGDLVNIVFENRQDLFASTWETVRTKCEPVVLQTLFDVCITVTSVAQIVTSYLFCQNEYFLTMMKEIDAEFHRLQVLFSDECLKDFKKRFESEQRLFKKSVQKLCERILTMIKKIQSE
jgi:hypothetical protein